jgi:diguanylate cyclase (GGDEF)-like protein
MPRTTIRTAFCAARRMPSLRRPALAGHTSNPSTALDVRSMSLCVFLWGDHHELLRELADANERVATLEARLAAGSRTDPRTGLLTVEAFRDQAQAALATGQPASLALVDVDDFRALNARHGTAAGDAALDAVACRLRALATPADILGRTGADELAVLMPGAPPSAARALCDGLVEQLAHADIPHAGRITVSTGVANHQPGMTIEALLAAAAAGLDRPHAHVIDALAAALAERDSYTGEHSASVVEMAETVAAALGLDDAEVEQVGHAALLHDIGKVGVPDRVLHKAGPLAGDEWELMREHPLIGERILHAIPGMGAVARMVRHEHERFDGRGYPDGLRGEEIPIGSRIILACDAYHAMTSDRAYRSAMAHEEAVAELVRGAGSQFDPRVVSALLTRAAARSRSSRTPSRG